MSLTDAAGKALSAVSAVESPQAEFDRILALGIEEDEVEQTSGQILIAAYEECYSVFEHRQNPNAPEICIKPLQADGQPTKTLVVVTLTDSAFIFDTISATLFQKGYQADAIAHPVFLTQRDRSGKLISCQSGNQEKCQPEPGDNRESVFFAVVSGVIPHDDVSALIDQLKLSLNDVRLAVSDWQAMRNRVKEIIKEFRDNPPLIDPLKLAECIQFLEWLNDNHFTYLGMRELAISEDAGHLSLTDLEGAQLGILRDKSTRVLQQKRQALDVNSEVASFIVADDPLIITKSDHIARVHRLTTADYIGIKRYDDQGRAISELRIVGLFTSSTFHQPIIDIPVLRRKQEHVLSQLGYRSQSHSGKAIVSILDNYPRSELFQARPGDLAEICQKILHLYEKPRIRVFLRRDQFGRFVTAQVFVPRDRYDSDVRAEIGRVLEMELGGTLISFEPTFLEAGLTRVYFVIDITDAKTQADLIALEAHAEAFIKEATTEWTDRFLQHLRENSDSHPALSHFNPDAFPLPYQDNHNIEIALHHADIFAALSDHDPIAVRIEAASTTSTDLTLSIFKYGDSLPLSKRVPLLENAGFLVISETTYEVGSHPAPDYFLYEMSLQTRSVGKMSTRNACVRLEDLLVAAFTGKISSDGLNALSLSAALSWQEVAQVRLYARYLMQATFAADFETVVSILTRYPDFAKNFIALSHVKFSLRDAADPKARETLMEKLEVRVQNVIDNAVSLTDERVLTSMLNTLRQTLRVNYFQPAAISADGALQLAMKLAPQGLEGLPEPRPYREIFTSGPQVEGVHMRFGPIARGGLRWSDRASDFRTEVLGLVKAQQVKNAVIVPVGAKGGFISRYTPKADTREAFLENGIAAYKLFISTMLSITDNRAGDDIVTPENVIAFDDKDPYLVVAADKGTATFSDIANGISQDHGFWLDDAFASGGSQGYDHKKMGITARGGWEAVKRHFREMDIDIQSEEFTVAGVGDMSGDVFGNGMLLSKCIRLIAAFDHRHIFLDPDPDAATSFKERERIFNLGRSSWDDYDRDLLSPGGMVIQRSAKSALLSQEVAARLGLEVKEYRPDDILTAILKADIDLLWFGGIGTYIRGSSETDLDVGDRGNDAIRIVGSEVGAKVIGEGANLGATQKGRIEFAHNGGRINTDAIDNSAGVNSSDVEVNIKIAFKSLMDSGNISFDERNDILEDMTEDVAELVLFNNYRQTLSLSMTEALGPTDLGFQNALMEDLERHFDLDRKVENLPGPVEMQDRLQADQNFTRPELATLIAYAKNHMFSELESSDRFSDPQFKSMLLNYFPERMKSEFKTSLLEHRLKDGILATELANSVINRGGMTLPIRMKMEFGIDNSSTAIAFLIARDAFDILRHFSDVEALDNKISHKDQMSLFVLLQRHLHEAISWVIKQADLKAPIAEQVNQLKVFVEAARKALISGDVLADANRARFDEHAQSLSELGLISSKDFAAFTYLERCLPLYSLGLEPEMLSAVIQRQFELGERIGLDKLAAQIAEPKGDLFEQLAFKRMKSSLFASLGRLAYNASQNESDLASAGALKRVQDLIASVDARKVDLAQMTLITGMLSDLA